MAPPEISPPPSPRVSFSTIWHGQSGEGACESDIGEVLWSATQKLDLHLHRFLDNRDGVATRLLEQQEYLIDLLERRQLGTKECNNVNYSSIRRLASTYSDLSSASGIDSRSKCGAGNSFCSDGDGDVADQPSPTRVCRFAERTETIHSTFTSESGLFDRQEVQNEEQEDCATSQMSEPAELPALKKGSDDAGNTSSTLVSMKSTSSFLSAHGKKSGILHAQVPDVWNRMLKDTLHKSQTRDLNSGRHAKLPFAYEATMMLVIILNALYVGWCVQYAARNDGYTSDTLLAIAFIFNAIYILDLVVRLSVERRRFFCGSDSWWNFFDTIVVLVMLSESILHLNVRDGSQTTGSRFAILRMFRVLRLMSLVHVIQYLFHVFREFRVLLYSIQKTGKSLFWSIVLYMLTVYFFSIGITQGALGSCGAAGLLPDYHNACTWFGSLDRTVLNLYIGALGGLLWGELQGAAEELGWQYSLLIIVFASFIKLIVLNVITGMVLEIYSKISRSAQHVMIDDAVHRMQKYVQTMNLIFKEIDLNESGGISYDEFKHALKDRRMTALLESLDVDVSNAEQIFGLLDKDGTGAVEIDEFIFGLMRMKGEAKSVDVLQLQVDSEWIMNQLNAIRKKIEESSGTHRNSSSIRPPHRSRHLSFIAQEHRSTKNLESRGRALTRNRQSTFKEPLSRPAVSIQSRPTVSIQSTEERGMTLAELESIASLINKRCEREEWTDPRTGKALRPQDVNLYHLNYYVICPETAPEGIELIGLDQKFPVADQPVVQTDLEFGSSLAEGVVTKERNDNPVVTITKGRFQRRAEAGQSDIRVDGTSVGIPIAVVPILSLSYKEVKSPTPTRARWFCSHWWGEPVLDFVKCCELHAGLRDMHNARAAYWVCAYANRQHSIDDDLCEDPDQSAFRRAMKAAEGVLLILDGKATPFKRIWCDFELYHTLSDGKPLDVVTLTGQGAYRKPHLLSQGNLPGETSFTKTKRESSFPINLLVSGICARLEDGDASYAPDKPAILKCMARNKQTGAPGSDADLAFALEHANGILHSYLALAAWPQAVKKACVENFDPQHPGTLCLPDVLARVNHMESFNLSLAHLQEVTDNDLKVLAKSFPESVTRLHLSFEGCGNITDIGISALLEALPPDLLEFSLDCQGCKQISDNGIEAVGLSLPHGLRQLDLHFATCPLIGMEGVHALADMLPKTIAHFSAGFQGTKVDKKFNSVKNLKKFVSGSPGHSNKYAEFTKRTLTLAASHR